MFGWTARIPSKKNGGQELGEHPVNDSMSVSAKTPAHAGARYPDKSREKPYSSPSLRFSRI
jgi:hypothetical protein